MPNTLPYALRFIALMVVALAACNMLTGEQDVTPVVVITPTVEATGTREPTAEVVSTATQTAYPAPITTTLPVDTPIAQPAVTPLPESVDISSAVYLDDRSSAVQLLRSFFNAINRFEYVRAYAYWQSDAAESQLGPYADFEIGYANTASVQLITSVISGDAGAGQLYYNVPVTLVVQNADSAAETFVGCYTFHLARPEFQAEPPFQPMAIVSATIQQVANDSGTAESMAAACPVEAAPLSPEPPFEPTDVSAARYLDDRSSAEQLLRSYFNAVNRREYARAYSYWEPEAAEVELQPFPQFQAGYADTGSVELTMGTVGSDAGAGQLYFTVPVTLVAQTTAGETQTFVGCYTLHLSQPGIQGLPPFRPLAITSADVQQVANDADTANLMNQSCQ